LSGQKVGCFFSEDNLSKNYTHNFTTSSEAEVGSAGEQPDRNSLMLEVNTSK
jgi:hypothetical protein